MRHIDRWVGVPICFLLTLWRRIADVVAPARPAAPIRNILIIQTAEMGSLVLALPSVRYIKEKYPRSRVYVLAFSHLRETVTAIGLGAARSNT